MRQLIFTIIGIIFVYFYIYAPPFKIIPVGMDKPFWLLSMIYITYNRQWKQLYQTFQKEFLCLSTIVFTSLFVFLVYRQDITLFSYDLLLLLECIPCAWAVYHLFHGKTVVNIDDILIICAIIGGIISFLLLLNPEYAYYIKNDILKFPEHLIDKFLYRGYGLSDGLMFSYPVIQGFCMAFIILRIGKVNIIYMFSLLLLFASIMSNARSGFVPVAIGILLLFFIRFKIFLKYFSLSVVLSIFLVATLNAFIENNEMLNASLEWSQTTFEIISDLLSGEQSENVEVLLNDMVIFPSNVEEWLIGSGEMVSSDIGYFIRLNYGGIVYAFLWCVFCCYMFIRLCKVNKGIALLLFISLLYLNYKADFFVVNPGSRFFIFVYVIIILDKSLLRTLLDLKK